MDEFGDLSGLIDDEPNPRDLVALLRKREALGELMAAGGPALAPQAQATLGGARQRLAAPRGESAATSLLKRTMALESIRKNQAIDAEDMAFVNTLPPDMRPLVRTKGDAAEARRGVMSGQIKALSPTEKFDQETTRQRLRMEEEERLRRAQEAKEERERKAAEKAKQEADAGKMGTDWELGPSSPLAEDPVLKREFLSATAQIRTARELAGKLKGMLKAGLGVTSKAEDLTRAESLVRRLQLIGKEVDKLGVLSAVDITKFVEPQLMNPTDFKAAALEGFGRFDPLAQVDQYLQNIEGKVTEVSKAWDVRPKAGGVFRPQAPASAPKRPRRTVNGETREWDGSQWVPVKG